LALRIGSAIYMGERVQVLPGVADQVSYDLLAQRLLAGTVFPLARTGGRPRVPVNQLPTGHIS